MTLSVTPEAIALFRQAMENLGRGRKVEGARQLFQAVKTQPNYFDALYNLALVLQELNQTSEAVACYQEALRIKPDCAPAWNNLGVAHKAAGRPDRAVDCHRRALALQPKEPSYHNNLANALRALDGTTEAIQELRTALQMDPSSAILWHTLGNTFREAGQISPSVAAFENSLKAEPSLVEAHWDLAFSLLLNGDLSRGWEEYEWRWRRKDYPPRVFAQPAWQGGDPSGLRLLVYAEQGAGDSIQFARYLPQLAGLGAKVILECPRSLARLLGTVQGVDRVVVKGEALPAFDRHCALISLPRWFKTAVDSIPNSVPYLRSPEAVPGLPGLTPANAGGLKVGLVWAGNPEHKNDLRRSMPLEMLRPLLARAGATFYSLQVRSGPARGPHALESKCVDLAPLIGDYADTAALVSQLDLVISVDTSVAHLAGALGRPVWLLLPCAPDWRWLLGRADSPWYPTMRLFRQRQPGDWKAVIDQVERELGRISAKGEFE